MTQKILMVLGLVMGIALVFLGHEWVSRVANAAGHLLILAALILAIRMNSKKESDQPAKPFGTAQKSESLKSLKRIGR